MPFDATRAPRALLGELGSFLLAAGCAGCDRPGVLLCDGCRAQLRPSPVVITTPGGLTVRASMPFDAVAARCIRRLKGDGETLLARPLGAALAAVLALEVHDGVDALRAVPVPTTRAAFRRRGYRVPELLVRSAGAIPFRMLRTSGVRVDQRGLGAGDRAQNVRGTMVARRAGHGQRVVLVDDVVTTGSTFDEGARALTAAGFDVVSAVALAATPSRSGSTADSSATHRRHGATDP